MWIDSAPHELCAQSFCNLNHTVVTMRYAFFFVNIAIEHNPELYLLRGYIVSYTIGLLFSGHYFLKLPSL